MNHHRDHTLKPNAVKSRIYKGSGTRWRRRRDIPGALDDRMLISRLGNLRNPDPTYCQQASKCTAESKHGKLLIYLPSCSRPMVPMRTNVTKIKEVVSIEPQFCILFLFHKQICFTFTHQTSPLSAYFLVKLHVSAS